MALPNRDETTGILLDRPADWFLVLRTGLLGARRHWRSLLAFALIGGAAGGGAATIAPSYYQSGAAFQAEPTTPGLGAGSLAGLASQFSNFQLNPQNNAQFFGDLITTDAVLRRLGDDSFPWQGQMTSLATIYGFERDTQALREYSVVRKLRRAVTVSVNNRTGVVQFSIEARTPSLAKLLADSVLSSLNATNIDLRRERAAAERTFTSERAEHAKEELRTSEQALTDFYERNRSIGNSPALQLLEAQLRRQVDMAQQVYVQLRLQEEQAAVQEVRNTPAISVIDPPFVPVRRSRPNRRLALVLGLFVGIMVGAVRIVLITRAGAI